MDKAEARRAARAAKSAMGERERREADEAVCAYILALAEAVPGAVCIYSPLPDETDVSAAARELVRQGREVYFPVMREGEIKLVSVTRRTKFTAGAYGIKEPVGEEREPAETEIALCITPLTAFTRGGGRVGRGKGCYDRFFAVCPCIKAGVAYSCAYVQEVELDKFDVPMDVMITQKGVLRAEEIK